MCWGSENGIFEIGQSIGPNGRGAIGVAISHVGDSVITGADMVIHFFTESAEIIPMRMFSGGWRFLVRIGDRNNRKRRRSLRMYKITF